ncbi:MAG TPA: UDP-N-acetylglucosamine 2-epimerase, partial [Gaiellaceae bacterium]|nr:UDP-N-acetylglucosamine 2-epimerase [Gaiellaceae bacterium]
AEPLRAVAAGLAAHEEPVVFPAHPRTTAALAAGAIVLPAHVRVLPPLGYLDFAALASQARVVATDSGGIQKEAYWYGVPCVTLRETTEWVETIEAGWNRLVGTDAAAIAAALADPPRAAERPELYGDGHAAERIAEHLGTMGRR